MNFIDEETGLVENPAIPDEVTEDTKIIVYVNYDPVSFRVGGYGSTSSGAENEIEIEIDRTHDFIEFPFSYIVSDGTVVKDYEYLLQSVRREKDAELNSACENEILGGFDFEIDGTLYHFSFDIEAQLNYQGAERLLSKGVVESVEFTVFHDGTYDRILIDSEKMDILSVAILNHTDSKVKRYRKVLLPLVNTAKTIEEVKAITWDMDTSNLEQEVKTAT
ncbi:hypothetical protein ABFV99_13075 [Cytobacillus horneckiae]|uniref:DUF4376 domain-containing protein n=1 Tax=Cytobacillus horneckiae TaxID=549687 RepID=UPI0034CEB5E3